MTLGGIKHKSVSNFEWFGDISGKLFFSLSSVVKLKRKQTKLPDSKYKMNKLKLLFIQQALKHLFADCSGG